MQNFFRKIIPLEIDPFRKFEGKQIKALLLGNLYCVLIFQKKFPFDCRFWQVSNTSMFLEKTIKRAFFVQGSSVHVIQTPISQFESDLRWNQKTLFGSLCLRCCWSFCTLYIPSSLTTSTKSRWGLSQFLTSSWRIILRWQDSPGRLTASWQFYRR